MSVQCVASTLFLFFSYAILHQTINTFFLQRTNALDGGYRHWFFLMGCTPSGFTKRDSDIPFVDRLSIFLPRQNYYPTFFLQRTNALDGGYRHWLFLMGCTDIWLFLMGCTPSGFTKRDSDIPFVDRLYIFLPRQNYYPYKNCRPHYFSH